MDRTSFDQLTCGLLSYLETHVAVSGIHFSPKDGVSDMHISRWEQDNSPLQLPEDLKAFLVNSNGVSVRWHVSFRNQHIPLGMFNINEIAHLKRLPSEGLQSIHRRNTKDHPDTFLQTPNKKKDGSKYGGSKTAPEGGSVFDKLRFYKEITRPSDSQYTMTFPVAVDLDSRTPHGQMALVYWSAEETDRPEIWFEDLSGRWHFISRSFTEYFRLMVVHLGIVNWPYVFTDIGLDPISTQWLKFMAPERLSIDRTYRLEQGMDAPVVPKPLLSPFDESSPTKKKFFQSVPDSAKSQSTWADVDVLTIEKTIQSYHKTGKAGTSGNTSGSSGTSSQRNASTASGTSRRPSDKGRPSSASKTKRAARQSYSSRTRPQTTAQPDTHPQSSAAQASAPSRRSTMPHPHYSDARNKATTRPPESYLHTQSFIFGESSRDAAASFNYSVPTFLKNR